MTPTSGEAEGIRLIRSISLIARALTSSGMPEASTFSRSSLISACCGSSSPSSRWMALSCSRRMYSRWVLSISDLTSDWILPLSSRISIWRARNVGDELEPLDDVDRLEQLLALLGGHVRAVGDHVGEQARLGDVARGDGRLRRHRGARLDVLLDLALDACAPAPGPRRPSGVSSASTSTRARDVRLGRLEAEQRAAAAGPGRWPARCRPGAGRPGRSWPGCRPRTARDGSVMSSRSAWRWVTSAMGEPSATASLSACDATCRGRPGAGTIISGKMTVSRSATSGSSRTSAAGSLGRLLRLGVRRRLAPSGLLEVGAGRMPARCRCRARCGSRRRGSPAGGPARPRLASAAIRRRCRLAGPLRRPFVVERFQDAHAESLLELEQDADPGEVHAQVRVRWRIHRTRRMSFSE